MCRSVFLALACWLAIDASAADLTVSPSRILLDSPESSQQLLVTEERPESGAADLTRSVKYSIRDPQVAVMDQRGVVHPLRDGHTELTIRHELHSIQVPIVVSGIGHPRPLSFAQEILPIFTKTRCNSGGCHGKAEGQNGFKLSVFGFDPVADHAALVKESRGRRLLTTAPSQSLLLLKAAATVPHGGGRKIDVGDLRYRRISRWIAEGLAIRWRGHHCSFHERATRTVRAECRRRSTVASDGG